jgi:hypothetical protein
LSDNLRVFLLALGSMLSLVFLLFDYTYIASLLFMFTVLYALIAISFEWGENV